MINSKMADHHLARQACIYIRQSTPGQVRFNQESKERQYNLANQAKALGWMPEQIRILDGERKRTVCLSITHKMRSPPSLPMRQIGESYESFVVSC